MDAVDLVVDALSQAGLEGRSVALTVSSRAGSRSDEGYDVLVDVGGAVVRLQLKRRALVTSDDALRLLEETGPSSPDQAVLLLVGDRVTDEARRLLTSRGAGYLDLRGRLALRTDRMVIDVPVDPVRERAGRVDALAGAAGLEVAVALLMQPNRPVGVRALAAELGRSASTVSEVLSLLRSDGSVAEDGRVNDGRLFWMVADRWPHQRSYLAREPEPGAHVAPLKLGLRDVASEPGWALTDTTAAAIYGAPVVARSGQMLDFYVPDVSVVRRATTLLGSATSQDARAAIRVAPVPAVCRQRINDVESMSVSGNQWPLAHPLFVAFDLAQDAGRGREILKDWNPGPRWDRVW